MLTRTRINHISPYGGFMGGSILKDKKTGHLFIQIRFNGRYERFYRFEDKGQWFPYTDYNHAQKILALMQSQVDDESFIPAAWRPNSPLSISLYSEHWLDSLSVCNNTLRFYRTCLKRCIEYFGNNKDIRKIVHSDLKLFYKKLPLAEKGKYHTLNTLKAMLRCALKDGYLKKMPEFPPLSDETETDIEYLTFEDQEKVLMHIPERDQHIFRFGMEFGLRIGEIRALKKDAIDGSHLIVKRSFSQWELRETTKTKRIRRLPLTTRAREILKNNPRSFSEYLFTFDGKTPYYERKLREIWKDACQKAGVTIHLKNAVRHSLGCQLLDADVEIEMVRDIYGHTTSDMTRRYAKRTSKKLLEALEKRGQVYSLTDYVPTKSDTNNS